MNEFPKTERSLRLIQLLYERKRTVPQLADILRTSLRNVYRDLDSLRNVGYQIRVDEHARYSLEENPSGSRLQFTTEEIRLIREYLSALPAHHPLKLSIDRKLYLSSELIPLADELLDKHRGTIISRINSAISSGYQLRLVRYHSTNSGSESDRVVEPISLTKDYSILNAFEPHSQQQKTFKIIRMDDVEVLPLEATSFVSDSPDTDLFGFTGPKPLPVLIRLSFTAYRLLIEEFPASRAYIRYQAEDRHYPYLFHIAVRDFRGIGRFLLGLPGEVVVKESEELRDYLRERAGKGDW